MSAAPYRGQPAFLAGEVEPAPRAEGGAAIAQTGEHFLPDSMVDVPGQRWFAVVNGRGRVDLQFTEWPDPARVDVLPPDGPVIVPLLGRTEILTEHVSPAPGFQVGIMKHEHVTGRGDSGSGVGPWRSVPAADPPMR